MDMKEEDVRVQCPDGLVELLESLTREILRQQPNDIIIFAEKYFDGLVKKRGNVIRKRPDEDVIISKEGAENDGIQLKYIFLFLLTWYLDLSEAEREED